MIRVTTLVDNTADARGLLAEHGFSLWIEVGDCRVLFDTGQGLALAHNAAALGVNLERADALVVSHGHYDHAGGLRHALAVRPALDVYLHPDALGPKFSTRGAGAPRDIGIPQADREALSRHGTLRHVQGPLQLCDRVTLTGPIPRLCAFEEPDPAFFKDMDARDADPLIDDQAAFVETPRGTVVLLGCGHSGVVNTLNHVARLTLGRPIHAVMGGMHLGSVSQSRLAATVRALRDMEIVRLIPAHCTGLAATAALLDEFQERCTPASVGHVFEIEGV
jgi:7,8-dihydropterin-6-yl-methyl-4-(beta-D-ribofuranosyl)aminobenzene 5'-phosphate synthase